MKFYGKLPPIDPSLRELLEKEHAEEEEARIGAHPASKGVFTAKRLLDLAANLIDSRGAERDQPEGERSMGRTVAAFNALTGKDLTEKDGWLFMLVLKQARAYGGTFRADDYHDTIGYSALLGESAHREQREKEGW